MTYLPSAQAKPPRTSDNPTTTTDVSTGGCETRIQPIPDTSATTDQNRNHPLRTLLFLLFPLLSAWKTMRTAPLRATLDAAFSPPRAWWDENAGHAQWAVPAAPELPPAQRARSSPTPARTPRPSQRTHRTRQTPLHTTSTEHQA